MDLEFLTQYCAPMIVGVCLCLGYIIKRWVRDVDNKYIPTINGAVGFLVAGWMAQWSLSPGVLLTGLFSGLAATGFYEAFRQMVEESAPKKA